jgi:hypothetical protein
MLPMCWNKEPICAAVKMPEAQEQQNHRNLHPATTKNLQQIRSLIGEV